MSRMSSSLVGAWPVTRGTGEHFRRAMDSPPVNLGREMMGVEMSVSSVKTFFENNLMFVLMKY